MATTTANLGLKLPTDADDISIADISDNFATLDALGKLYGTQIIDSAGWHAYRFSDGFFLGVYTGAYSNVAVDIAWGSQYRSAEIGSLRFPVTFSSVPLLFPVFNTTTNTIADAQKYTGLTAESTGGIVLVRGEPGTCTGTLGLLVLGWVG